MPAKIYAIRYLKKPYSNPLFKEKYFCSLKLFSWIFADIPASGSSFSQVVKSELLWNPSLRLVYTDFGLILNRVILFRAFFSASEKKLLKLVQTNFLQFFQFLTVEAVFPAGEHRFSIERFIPVSRNRFLV